MSIPPWQFRYFCYTESEGARRQPRPLLSFCFVVRLGICQSAEAKPQPEDSEGNQTRFAASWFSAESFSALAFPLSPPPFHGFIIPQWHVRVNWRREISPQKSQLFRTILKRLEHCELPQALCFVLFIPSPAPDNRPALSGRSTAQPAPHWYLNPVKVLI